jgi:hypothetical protein
MRMATRIGGLLAGDRVIALLAVLVAVTFLESSGSAMASEPVTIDGESVSGITAHDATLEAQIDPHGLYTAYEFQIDTSSHYNYTQLVCPLPGPWAQCLAIIVGEELPPGLIEPSPESIPAVVGDQSVSIDLGKIGSTLDPNTTYHYRVIATNNGGEVVGPDQTFTTLSETAERPVIESDSVTDITQHDATFEAQIAPNGLETSYQFRVVESPCHANPLNCELVGESLFPSPAGEIAPVFGVRQVSIDLDAAGKVLEPGLEYHYSVLVKNSDGEESGTDQVFTTPPADIPPAVTPGAPDGGSQSGSSSPSTGFGGPAASMTRDANASDRQVGEAVGLKLLTREQKLARALKACKSRPKPLRASCVRLAHKKYGRSHKRKW